MTDSDFFDSLETRSADERESAQFKSLGTQLSIAKSKSSAYTDLLRDVDPSTVVDRSALAQIPVTRKSELIQRQSKDKPFGGLVGGQLSDCRQIFASPGPIYEPEGHKNNYWRLARALYAAGFRRGDIAYNTFSYHFTPAGSMLQSGALELGCAVFPAGPAQTELQIQTINDLRPNAYVGTPSFLRLLIDKSRESGNSIDSFTHALVSGEALPTALRDSLASDGVNVMQCYATADVGLIAYESSALHGMILDEQILVEIVRPGTGDPVADGEVGEMVITMLDNPLYPLIRFATGDLSALMDSSSPCGRTNRCIKGWMGRADQTTKIRGMFVHPEQVDRVVKAHPEVTRARLVVARVGHNDEMTLQCECGSSDASLGDAIAESLRAICKLRGTVELVTAGSLPNDGKVIDDTRPID
ncbi:MAG: AMP-binding protein [Pseudomonadota bacterium]